jgi:hypothetical protein
MGSHTTPAGVRAYLSALTRWPNGRPAGSAADHFLLTEIGPPRQ